MAIIDPMGLFNGDRLRRCSNTAQLHWPRLFLASDGFGRLEINYARMVGTVYPTFNPIPSETELQSFIQEYWKNFLLFIYEVDGRLWGQWDTRKEFLPRYKTAIDRRSPSPPEPAFTEWKKQYRQQSAVFPKCFKKISEAFQHGVGVGVGVGVGKNICASQTDARVGEFPSINDAAFETTEPNGTFAEKKAEPKTPTIRSMTPQQEAWFAEWWSEYWRHRGKKEARAVFAKQVKTEERFSQVMAATKAQKPEMLARNPEHRPYPATWLRGERWEDEPAQPKASEPKPASSADEYGELIA